MSRKIRDRVWQHSKLSGANKLLLLALAEQADDDGFTWVSYKTLAPMVGVVERQVYRLVDNLIEKGELLVWDQQGQQGGRGYTNIYLVTAGLTQEQIAHVVQSRFELVNSEIDSVISKKGDIYIRLCDVKRIAPATLERTRKPGGYVTLQDEDGNKKPDTSVTHNPNKGDGNVTQKGEVKPESPVKPDTSVTRLHDSLNPIESKDSKQRAANRRPPAILVYQIFHEETGKYCLNNAQIKVIEKEVGTDPDALQRWRESVRAWNLTGNNPKDATGMLDWFRTGKRSNFKGNGNGTHSSISAQPVPLSQQSLAIAAALKSKSKGVTT